MLTNEKTGLYCYAQLCNVAGDGMYLETEYSFKPGAEFDIRFDNPPFKSAAKQYHGIVKWCRRLGDDESISSFGIGVKYR